MKKVLFFILAGIINLQLFAQQKVYNENLDGMQQINTAIRQAQQENKYV